ncbi:hypothetical protein SEEM841_07942 [Salmonella enterica subsp. enterica serovar Senftenberg str. 423984-1]|nr:hypothetical protein SEEM841_07942 [Salmonella enterica subsp. enterica serovar Senftenberg str. 423984-1]
MYPVSSVITVYPRWRGEHFKVNCKSTNCAGLSPLARGTRGGFQTGQSAGRFIPAGAGNTARRLNAFLISAVYPRWRGEHYHPLKHTEEMCGLSPLARGTH